MTNTEARRVDYDECPIKCAKSRERNAMIPVSVHAGRISKWEKS